MQQISVKLSHQSTVRKLHEHVPEPVGMSLSQHFLAQLPIHFSPSPPLVEAGKN